MADTHLVKVDDHKDDRDQYDVGQKVEPIAFFEQVAWGDQVVVDEEDDQVGDNLSPDNPSLIQVDVQLGEHLRVEYRNQDDGRPNQQIEEVFAQGVFLADLHENAYFTLQR